MAYSPLRSMADSKAISYRRLAICLILIDSHTLGDTVLAFEDRRTQVFMAVGGVLILAVVLLYVPMIRSQVGLVLASQINDVLNIVLAFMGAVLCFMLARSFGRTEVLFTIWMLLGVGLILWGLGESLFAWQDIFLDENSPIASVADIPWVLGYLPLIAGLLLRFRSLQTELERRWIIALVVGFVVIVALASITVFAPILRTSDVDVDTYTRIIGLLYPIVDLLLALCAMLTVLVLSGGRLSQAWIFIAAGFIIVGAADLLYSAAYWQGQYVSGEEGTNLISAFADISYTLSYIVLVFGLILQARLQKVI
jgi:hypothetical protein